jgi:site-specific DNA recombinase
VRELRPRPDIHPNVSEIFCANVARLAETLDDPVGHAQAAQAIRNLISRVILSPDPDSGDIKATLEGQYSPAPALDGQVRNLRV